MKAKQLKERLETWLKLAEQHSEILAAEADWQRILLKSAAQIEICTELTGSQSEKDLLAAVTLARPGRVEAFEQVADLFRAILQHMRTKGMDSCI
jgi:hypothetical protein